MSILHANSDPDFLSHLRDVIKDAEDVDIAVGYFYLSGFLRIADLLKSRKGKVRILIGRTDKPTADEINAAYNSFAPDPSSESHPSRKDQHTYREDVIRHIKCNAAAQRSDNSSEKGVKALSELIASGQITVRAYLKGRLHAKAYIGSRDSEANPGVAIIGSTNLSESGLVGNTELNYPVRHDDDFAEIKQWFDALWKESEEVSDDIVETLKSSWPLFTPEPYMIYLKVLFEFFGDLVRDSDEPIAWRAKELTDYQKDAVTAGLAMIEKHGGCYIADVVGTGKSYIGAELLRRLVAKPDIQGDPLVICPAGLRKMWMGMCDDFGLFDAEVVSRSRLTEKNELEDRALRKVFRRSGPVLIDEAHGFRNNTQGRKVLLNFLRKGTSRPVVLLSATPQNLSPRDIVRQLELFLDVIHHKIPGVDEDLRKIFSQKNADPNKIAAVLCHVLLRRRRKDIREHYPNSTLRGQPISFPEPVLSNLEYSLEKVYRKAGGFKALANAMCRYRAVRYSTHKYLLPEAIGKYSGIEVCGKGNLSGLIKGLIWKRLESSVASFQSTLGNLIESVSELLNRLNDIKRDIGFSSDDSIGDQRETEDLNPERIWIRDQEILLEDIDTERWKHDLRSELDILKRIRVLIKDINAEDDSKLQKLVTFISRPEVRNEKLLVFTESAVTAKYLHRHLSRQFSGVNIDVLVGGDPRAGEKVYRFSPVSNPKQTEKTPPKEKQTRILIATDVVSEGQNLQDCGRVLNYDLHWNPVTLIQRFGRVDRITTKHQKIFLHNMLPGPELEGEILVKKKVRERIRSLHKTIGLDNVILDNGEKVQPESIYAIYDGVMPQDPDDQLDYLSTSQKGISILGTIKREKPELWDKLLAMPAGLRASTVKKQRGKKLTWVLVFNHGQNQGLVVKNPESVNEVSLEDFIAAVECSPKSKPGTLPNDINRRIRSSIDFFSSQQQVMRYSGRSRLTPNQKYIKKHLYQFYLDPYVDQEFLIRIEGLRKIFFQSSLPPGAITGITRLRKEKVSGEKLVNALSSIAERWELKVPPKKSILVKQTKTSQAHVVCSLTN